ncbi:MAG: hypothetical protein AAGC57_03725 [Pseudomonadota bacterium]
MFALRVVLAGALVLMAGGAPLSAIAGAWTQKPGSGQAILSASRKSGQFSPFPSSRESDDSTFTALFAEYGALEGLTVGGTVFVEFASGDDDNSADVGLFVRQRLWQGEAGDVASVQFGAKQEINDLLGDDFGGPGADPTNEISLRLLYGRGWGFEWGSAFLSTEGGYHYQTDGDEDELRVDITVGAQPDPCCMGLLSLFSTFPVEGEEDVSIKIAPSFAYSFHRPNDGGKPVTLQIGFSQDLADFDDGLGVQLSVWKPF